MRIVWSLILLACILAAAPAPAAEEMGGPDAAHTQRFEFEMPGNMAWLDTGILLKKGDSVTFAAKGTVFFSNWSGSHVDPQGYGYEAYHIDFILDDAAYCYDPFHEEKWNHAGLVGRVGKNDAFFIGPKRVIAGKAGPLYLGINDCSLNGENYPNRGSFQVVVIVDRGK